MIDVDTRRELNNLMQGTTFTGGVFTLAANPATSTVVTRTSISEQSIIHYTAYSTNAVQSDITRIVPASGSFTVFHSASVNTRTYRYSFVTSR